MLNKLATRVGGFARRRVLLIAGSVAVSVGMRRRLMRACGVAISDSSVVYGQLFVPYGRLTVGEDSFINFGFRVIGQGAAHIEPRVSIGPDVRIYTDTHPISDSRQRAGAEVIVRDARVGRGSWIGGNVTLLPGVSIAPGCIIGAGSVVTRSTAPDGLYVGIPAARVRDLPPLVSDPLGEESRGEGSAAC